MRGARADQGRNVVYAAEAGKDLHEVRVGDVVRAAVVEERDVVVPGDQRVSVSIHGALVEVDIEGAASLEIRAGLGERADEAGPEHGYQTGVRVVDETVRWRDAGEESHRTVRGQIDESQITVTVGVAIDVEHVSVRSEGGPSKLLV